MTWEVKQGDVCDVLRTVPTESVHCVVTSPPYFGLRAYKTEPQVWGGEAGHEHIWQVSKLPDTKNARQGSTEIRKHPTLARLEHAVSGSCCSCGAWRGELGLEPMPELYVQHLVEVFREVKRVLRSNGVLFCNLGDTYWGGKGQSGSGNPEEQAARAGIGISLNRSHHQVAGYGLTRPQDGRHAVLKSKDLVGIPWRVAFALQADGWWIRSDIIWNKLNPMPESVTDRPTKSHEYVFMLTKSARYFFNQEAVREPILLASLERAKYGWYGHMEFEEDVTESKYRSQADHIDQMGDRWCPPTGRNLRTVWTIPTQPFSDAHFSTFPEKLVEPCIRAGTSEKGCCAACGAPWKRVIKKSGGTTGRRWHDHVDDAVVGQQSDPVMSDGSYRVETLGWNPTCSCSAETIPATVLDPFVGSGTTGIVALKLGRSFIGIDLNPAYVEMAQRRIGDVMPLFEVSPLCSTVKIKTLLANG